MAKNGVSKAHAVAGLSTLSELVSRKAMTRGSRISRLWHQCAVVVIFFVAGCTTTKVDVSKSSDEQKPVNWETLAYDTSFDHHAVACANFPNDTPIAIYETELARIEIPIADVIISLEEFQVKRPDIPYDDSLLALLRASDGNVIDSTLDQWMKQRLFWRVSDLMRDGKAKVWNKGKMAYEEEIIVAQFFYYFDELFAGGGWIFLFKGTNVVFLEAQNWIS